MSIIQGSIEWIQKFPALFMASQFSVKFGYCLIILASLVIIGCMVSLFFESFSESPSQLPSEPKKDTPSKKDTPQKASPNTSSAPPAPVASSTKEGKLPSIHFFSIHFFSLHSFRNFLLSPWRAYIAHEE
jgi:hypothetical protein